MAKNDKKAIISVYYKNVNWCQIIEDIWLDLPSLCLSSKSSDSDSMNTKMIKQISIKECYLYFNTKVHIAKLEEVIQLLLFTDNRVLSIITNYWGDSPV